MCFINVGLTFATSKKKKNTYITRKSLKFKSSQICCIIGYSNFLRRETYQLTVTLYFDRGFDSQNTCLFMYAVERPDPFSIQLLPGAIFFTCK